MEEMPRDVQHLSYSVRHQLTFWRGTVAIRLPRGELRI